MLSYRHAFHAGNFADVLKHSTLCLVLESLRAKDKPFFCLDVFAGAGIYDLGSQQANKTGEWQRGIGRLWGRTDLPAPLAPYMAAVAGSNPAGRLDSYPGSPALIRSGLRQGDRLGLVEMHPADFAFLQAEFGRDRRIGVYREDGWQSLKSRLPPLERRGLVLIDPSYEIKTDWDKAVESLTQGFKRFATGTFMLWYPVVERERTESLCERIAATGIRRILRAEQSVLPDQAGHGMTGAGLLLVNPPWKLDLALKEILPFLDTAIGRESPRHRLEWLAGE